MNGCIFCGIVEGRLPAEVLAESDRSIAILDIQPIHHGHALVIPRVHAREFLDLEPEAAADMIALSQRVLRGIVRATEAGGYNVFCNNGDVAGQSVMHAHIHLTPRFVNDGIRFQLELKKYAPGEMETMGKRIRNALTAEQDTAFRKE